MAHERLDVDWAIEIKKHGGKSTYYAGNQGYNSLTTTRVLQQLTNNSEGFLNYQFALKSIDRRDPSASEIAFYTLLLSIQRCDMDLCTQALSHFMHYEHVTDDDYERVLPYLQKKLLRIGGNDDEEKVLISIGERIECALIDKMGLTPPTLQQANEILNPSP